MATVVFLSKLLKHIIDN